MELKKMGEIKDLLREGESGFHKLYAVDRSEFKKIHNMLGEIEIIIDSINEPLDKFPFPQVMPPISQNDFDMDNEFKSLMNDYKETFKEAIPVLIQELLNRISNMVHLEKDKQILNSRILELQQKYNKTIGEEEGTTAEKLGWFLARLGHINLKAPYLARIRNTNPNFLNECVVVSRKFQMVLQNFKKEFLSQE